MKKYCITDPQYYSSNPQIFTQKLLHVASFHQPDFICLRDKITLDYPALAKAFWQLHKVLPNSKMYLHTDFELASSLGCHGVHLPSHRVEDIVHAKALNLEVVFSAHSIDEMLKAQELGADAVTISPVFATPNKGKPLGLEKLKEINDKITIKSFALGGIINDVQVKDCANVGVYGFASIRYFLD